MLRQMDEQVRSGIMMGWVRVNGH